MQKYFKKYENHDYISIFDNYKKLIVWEKQLNQLLLFLPKPPIRLFKGKQSYILLLARRFLTNI